MNSRVGLNLKALSPLLRATIIFHTVCSVTLSENLKRKCHFDVEDSSHMEPLNMT